MTEIEMHISRGGKCHISISGHTGYAEYGQDIVCAAISGLSLALHSAGQHIFSRNELKNGGAEFVAEDTDGVIFGIFLCAVCGFRAVEKEYPENVKIKNL